MQIHRFTGDRVNNPKQEIRGYECPMACSWAVKVPWTARPAKRSHCVKSPVGNTTMGSTVVRSSAYLKLGLKRPDNTAGGQHLSTLTKGEDMDNLSFKELANSRDALKLLVRLGVLEGVDVINVLHNVERLMLVKAEDQHKGGQDA